MNTSIRPQQALYKAIFQLLRPLVRILLRNGVPYSAFTDIAKRAYVDIAIKEFAVPGKKQTNSRVSTITGLSRKEIQRLRDLQVHTDDDGIRRYNRAARVVYGWVHDSYFSDVTGDAAVLDFEGSGKSFSTLVKQYSGDIPPRAICDELERVGVVEKLGRNKVRLLERAYIPKAGEVEKLALLGRDVAGLISTMDHNIHAINPKPKFQRKVFYDNLPDYALEELQALLSQKGQSLLEYLDQWMAEHDRDVNPKIEGEGRHAAGIGIYFFEEEVEAESEAGRINSSVNDSCSQDGTDQNVLKEKESQAECDVGGDVS